MKTIIYDKTFLSGNLKGITVRNQTVQYPDGSVPRVIDFPSKTQGQPAKDTITNAAYVVSNVRVSDE